jgi:tetratricopeptide (TPR) repeat protein
MRATNAGLSDALDISEWDRIRSFLQAPDAPLALMEVEYPAQAEEVIDSIRSIVGAEKVHVFRPDPAQDFRGILDWLEAQGDSEGVFLIAGLDHYTSSDEATSELWSWANVQRERWQRDHGKVVFVLSPAQVDALCRYAPMLWEWISLKFNLIEGDEAERRLSTDGGQPDDAGTASEDLTVRLAVLRQQLLRARQTGLPEKLVVRYYAWPLFQQLIAAKRYEEAHQLLESDLGYGFLLGLLPGHAVEARNALDELGANYRPDIPHLYQKLASSVDGYSIASAFLLVVAGVLTIAELVRGLPDHVNGDWAAAERRYRELHALAHSLGWDKLIWLAQRRLGNVAGQQGDLRAAEAWYRQAFMTCQQRGDLRLRGGAVRICGDLEELARKRGDWEEAASWHDKGRALRPPGYELTVRLRGLARRVGTKWLTRLARLVRE